MNTDQTEHLYMKIIKRTKIVAFASLIITIILVSLKEKTPFESPVVLYNKTFIISNK